MENREIITVFLVCRKREQGKILLFRRSNAVGSYQGHWAGVSGYLESPTPLEHAYVELAEETGLAQDDLELIHQGQPLVVEDKALGVRWVAYPFCFSIESDEKIRLDYEHTECRWFTPEEVLCLDVNKQTVPRLYETLGQVLPQ